MDGNVENKNVENMFVIIIPMLLSNMNMRFFSQIHSSDLINKTVGKMLKHIFKIYLGDSGLFCFNHTFYLEIIVESHVL